ncbi:MAG TPA: ABC transporter permease [Pseudomonadales bacterium]|nr:ABC transporter permease [Pseudomonadales bacterium]
MLRLLFPFAWRNLWRNRRRTLITLLVVSIGVWSILTFNSVIRAWADGSLASSLKNMTAEAQIHARGYLDQPDIAHSFAKPSGNLEKVLDGPLVAHWAPRIRVPAIVQSEYETLPVTLAGIDPGREVGVSFIGEAMAEGRNLDDASDAGVLLGRHLATRLKTEVGKRIVIMANDANGRLVERGARVEGIFAASSEMEDQFVFTGLLPARKLLHVQQQLSEIAVMTPQDIPLAKALAAMQNTAPGLDIEGWATLQPMTRGIHDLTNGFIYIWLWVMFVLIAIGVVNTQLMAVFERTREFGLLQALGFRPSWIVLEVMLEAVQIIGLGVLVGAIGALMTVTALSGGISLSGLGLSAGADFLGVTRVLYPRLDVSEFFVTVVVIWGLGVLTVLWPARRAAGFDAIEAMHSN